MTKIESSTFEHVKIFKESPFIHELLKLRKKDPILKHFRLRYKSLLIYKTKMSQIKIITSL